MDRHHSLAAVAMDRHHSETHNLSLAYDSASRAVAMARHHSLAAVAMDRHHSAMQRLVDAAVALWRHPTLDQDWFP